MIKTAHKNILESSAVSLSAGVEDSSFPLSRLYDRSVSLSFRSTIAETLKVVIDQGGSPIEADTLIIPSGHNLEGLILSLQHSSDGIAYTDVLPPWVAVQEVIEVSWTALTKRYWKFIVSSPSVVPSIAEIFITSAYAWQRLPERPVRSLEGVTNITQAESAAGASRILVHGPMRRRRQYSVPRCEQEMKDEMLSLWDTHAEGKPVWLLDHDEQWVYGAITGELGLTEVSSGYWSFEFEFSEVLA